jgi:hypothetical protein
MEDLFIWLDLVKYNRIIEHYHIKIGSSIAIWSNGPNQNDDLGLGDDIKGW